MNLDTRLASEEDFSDVAGMTRERADLLLPLTLNGERHVTGFCLTKHRFTYLIHHPGLVLLLDHEVPIGYSVLMCARYAVCCPSISPALIQTSRCWHERTVSHIGVIAQRYVAIPYAETRACWNMLAEAEQLTFREQNTGGDKFSVLFQVIPFSDSASLNKAILLGFSITGRHYLKDGSGLYMLEKYLLP